MITIPLIEACIAIGGRPNKTIPALPRILHITTHPKEVSKGTLYVALQKNDTNNQEDIKSAEDAGAIAAVVAQEAKGIAIPQFIVPCTKEALGGLARIWRGRLRIPLIAITGSVGKTTTKALVAHLLEEKHKVHKSRRNLNDALGIPKELMRLDTHHEYSILELGMQARHQINYLSKIARPTLSVITNIGWSHIQKLGSRAKIAKAKAEIFEGMDNGGISILNHDDDFFPDLAAVAKGKIISFGTHKNSGVRITNIQLNPQGNPKFNLNGIPIVMKNCLGKHYAYVAATAFAIGLELGMKPFEMAARISWFKAQKRKGIRSFSFNKAHLLDYTYDASPLSLKPSLETLSHLHQFGNRTIAVIGDMSVLGKHSQEAHQHIAEFINNLGGIDMLVTIGIFSRPIGMTTAVKNKRHFENTEQAALFLLDQIKESDIVLLQGANDMHMNHIVAALKQGDFSEDTPFKISRSA